MDGTGVARDVVVAGDGPAAAAVAAACCDRGLDVVVVGPSASWPHTYGMWRDEAPELPDHCFATVVDRSVVRARRERSFARAYGVIDNDALRRHLGLDGMRRHGVVERQVDAGGGVVAHLDDGEAIAARWLVDATGATAATAWQTAYGVVVADAEIERVGLPTDAASVMCWLPDSEPTAFVHAVPVPAGWLVEVTSLAARPAVDPVRLRRSLIGLLGEAAVVAAEALGRTETVCIPMGGVPLPRPGGRIVPFGVAGGLGHPATGHSLAASLTAAAPVAAAIAEGRDPVAAMWPSAQRRTRTLHDAGLGVLLSFDRDELIDFFDACFDLPGDLWADYLRVDAPDERVRAAMAGVFRRSRWSVRRRLLGVDKRLLFAGLHRTRAN